MSHLAPRLVFRPVTRSSTPIRLQQRRHARVHDVRFVTTHQQSGTIQEKYRAKLEHKAKAEGHETISSLKEAYADKISEYRQKATKPPPGASIDTPPKLSPLQHPPPPPPEPQSQSSPSHGAPSHKIPETGIKPLSSYLDLPRISSLPAKEVEYIWRLRHASDPKSLCAVIPLATYRRIFASAQQHPQFILPLPRPAAQDGSGDIEQNPNGFGGDAQRTTADVHFLQWGFHPPADAGVPSDGKGKTENTHTSTVIFTHLAAFKLHGEHAQPHTTITHHLDLADSHGLVLLNGSVVEGRGVSADEGRWLLMCLQKFYDFEGHGGGVGREKRQELLRKFSSGDSSFSLEELLDEAERVS